MNNSILGTPEAQGAGKFYVAYSPHITNKQVTTSYDDLKALGIKAPYIEAFEMEWMDYERLAEITTQKGWAISRPFKGLKNDGAITHMSYVGLDFDQVPQVQFEAIKSHPLLKGRGFFHPSASSKTKSGVNGHWICRLEQVFRIETAETRAAWGLILQQIIEEVKISDRKGTDLQRLFYGAKGVQGEVWGLEPIRTKEIEDIYARALKRQQEEQEKQAQAARNSKKKRRGYVSYTYREAEKITEKYVLPQLRPDGSFPDVEDLDSYYAWLAYFLGWSQQLGLADAAKLMDKFAPDKDQGSLKKLKSFDKTENKGRVYTFGTTMRLLLKWGYDPRAEVFGKPEIKADSEVLPPKRFLTMDDLAIDAKVILVQSPKGTGKTELIKTIANSGLRVLIVGHRVALLRNTTERTGIPNYRAVDPASVNSLCITVDSLHKLNLERQHFDVVIIDELEQVLMHCTGDTLKENRPTELQIFKWLIKQADRVYGFDADLSEVSVNFMARMVNRNNVHVLQNNLVLGGKTVEMFASKYDVELEILEALEADQKVAVATNSRKDAEEIQEILKREYPGKKVLCITQNNSDQKDIQDFIANINERVGELDALIYSPSLGTGVSVDPEEPHFDTVFLIGVKDVTTHFDLDQQICRIRKIKSNTVKAYVAFNFDNEQQKPVDVLELKKTCVANSHETGVRISIDDDGKIQADTSDGWYIDLWADITAFRNKSMNNLRRCFVKLMEQQGHVVVEKPAHKDRKEMKGKSQVVRQELTEIRAQAIADAEDLDPLEYQVLVNTEDLRDEDKAKLAKYVLHEFYQQPVTKDLVVTDGDGKFQETVVLLEMVAGYQDAGHYDTVETSVTQTMGEWGSRIMVPHRKFYGPKKQVVKEFFEAAGFGAPSAENLRVWGSGYWFGRDVLRKAGLERWLDVMENRERLRRLFDITVPTNYGEQLTLIVGMMLRKLGIMVEEKRTRSPGSKGPVRLYKIADASKLALVEIIEARKARHVEMQMEDRLLHAIMVSYEEKGLQKTVKVTDRETVDFAKGQKISRKR